MNATEFEFASPSALAGHGGVLGALRQRVDGVSGWIVALTALLAVIAYDQIAYQVRKGPIAGPLFKIPIMGSFLDSRNPTFAGYLRKWESGPLSCVSVFHK